MKGDVFLSLERFTVLFSCHHHHHHTISLLRVSCMQPLDSHQCQVLVLWRQSPFRISPSGSVYSSFNPLHLNNNTHLATPTSTQPISSTYTKYQHYTHQHPPLTQQHPHYTQLLNPHHTRHPHHTKHTQHHHTHTQHSSHIIHMQPATPRTPNITTYTQHQLHILPSSPHTPNINHTYTQHQPHTPNINHTYSQHHHIHPTSTTHTPLIFTYSQHQLNILAASPLKPPALPPSSHTSPQYHPAARGPR
ncbi:hypothetical protein Pcinc_018181 [Petrolisthes cinctipes]|uniref:Uncharacterized protein n=1 Tax=Petrolisthes cinctipes TaxID=88211 RepID=A0AAE1FP88_PETCI|nr:hypothetical protein Pcinc_018181 [Petrolisthes cinctipes]